MAQQDTGYGWSAEATYLRAQSGAPLGSVTVFGGASFPGQPPAESDGTGLNVVANGIFLYGYDYQYDSGAQTRHREHYFTSYSGRKVLCFRYSNHFVFVSDTSGQVGWNCEYFPNKPTPTAGAWGIYTNNYDSTYQLYYADGTVGSEELNPNWNPAISVFNSRAEGLAAVQRTTLAFTKDSNGYSVACWAKWYNQGGVKMQSPVLISSSNDYIDIATTGTGLYSATASKQYDGITFKMRFYQNVPDETPTTSVMVVDLTENGNIDLDTVFSYIISATYANITVTETIDPYGEFGNTEEDAGEVDPEPDDDDIEEDALPTTSFADAGFCRIYKPTLLQINDLADYMWTDQTFLQTVINHLKQILENPIDSIISLSLVPCVPPTSSDVEVKVMFIPTGVYMPPVTNQFVEVDCGTVALKEMYGSALDYNPYTSVQLYLPYVGIVQLDTDEVMGKLLHVGYRIDVVTGVCCAYVKAGSDVLYQFSGHCSIQQPITSADFSGYVNAALTAGKLVASIAAAGAGAPEVAATLAGAPTPSISSTSSETRITERNEATGRQITAGTRRREAKTENPGASFGEIATRGVSNTVGAVMNSKTIVQHSGGFSGNSGYLAAVRRPYLIVTRPRIANPEKYGQFNGRPSMIYLNLGSCTGFTQVQSIQLTGIDATNPELSEIATLLTSGVIF